LLAPTGLLHSRWALFPTLLPLRNELEHWLKVQSPESLIYDDQATQNARLKAGTEEPPVLDFYNAGNLLVKPGELIDEGLLELLQREYDALDARVGHVERIIRVAIVFILILVLAGLIGHYLVRNEPALVRDIGRLSLYLAMCVLSVALARGLSFDPWRAEVGPVLVCVMVCAVVYSQMLATLTAFALSLIVTVSTGSDLGRFAGHQLSRQHLGDRTVARHGALDRQLAGGRLVPGRGFPGFRQPAIHRIDVWRRDRYQPFGTGRRIAPDLARARAPRPRNV
jgi:hypothetical protein